MESYNGITIAICTRNRQKDLESCMISIAKQEKINKDCSIEVLIIDDGDLSEEIQNKFKKTLPLNIKFGYLKKFNPGLLRSRVEAVSHANFEIILFLDDDVELEKDYIAALWETYSNNPTIVGVGGIDTLMKTSFKWELFQKVICYDSGKPGKLSKSGYGGAMVRWKYMEECFETEFLSGCNMSFKKSSLKNLKQVDWLNSYSLGEDIYLSIIASKSGLLMINPNLKVQHKQSPTSRDNLENVSYTEIVNHYYLLNEKKARKYNYIFQIWTSFGLALRSLLKSTHRPRAKGYFKGLKFITTELVKSKIKIG